MVLNGAPTDPSAGSVRLPGNVHLSFPGCEGDSLLMLLDAHGVECSTGSACSACRRAERRTNQARQRQMPSS